MKRTLALLFVCLSMSVLADPAREVWESEKAFAKAFADRDREKFFAFILDEAVFFPHTRTLGGKQQVVARWSAFFDGPQAPFSWGPERVSVDRAGTTAISMGPVYDTDGKQSGSFSTVWVKQKDGAWKVLFDSPGPAIANFSEDALPVEEGFVKADDGVRLHYRKAGNRPLTVIVPLAFVMYDDFKQLADVATVIAYDPGNRGRSDRVEDTSTLTIRQDVRDLEAVRKHFNLDRFVPVGYSYLGLMVAMYALDHPTRVARIVQLGPVPMKFDTEYPKHLTHGREDVAVPPADLKKWQDMRAAGMSSKSPREFCEAQGRVFQYVLVGDGAHASRVASHCDLENEWPVNFERHLQHHFESVKKVALTADDLKKLTMPVLTIHGTKDRNAPYGSGREWAEKLPNARLVTVEGAAHQSWSDDPPAVFASIREFLRDTWPMAAAQ